MSNDLDLFGMVVIASFGFYGAVRNVGWCFRAGSVITSVVSVFGLAYAWGRFSGGVNHDAGTHFGCLMLSMGVLGWLLFRGLSIALKRNEIKDSSTNAESDSARRQA